MAGHLELDNILFFDEINPDQIQEIYQQCHIGIVALDHRYKSHNIPGKFLSYMQNGLPVLASINSGNDLAKLIKQERVGQVCESNQIDELLQLTQVLLDQIKIDNELSNRCLNLFEREFASKKAVNHIVNALSALFSVIVSHFIFCTHLGDIKLEL